MPSTKKFRFTDKNGNTIEVDIGAEGENVTIDGQKLTDLLNGKADKQNSEGGFAAGYQASSGEGGAVGYQAKVNYGAALLDITPKRTMAALWVTILNQKQVALLETQL